MIVANGFKFIGDVPDDIAIDMSQMQGWLQALALQIVRVEQSALEIACAMSTATNDAEYMLFVRGWEAYLHQAQLLRQQLTSVATEQTASGVLIWAYLQLDTERTAAEGLPPTGWKSPLLTSA